MPPSPPTTAPLIRSGSLTAPTRSTSTTSQKALPSLASLSSKSPSKPQSTFTRVVHHGAWTDLYTAIEANAAERDLVRFISASQEGATAFHRALPFKLGAAIPSEIMLAATQLGLPLSCLAGLDCDQLGDSALNSTSGGDFLMRHNKVLDAWVAALKRAYCFNPVSTAVHNCRIGDIISDGYIKDLRGPGLNHLYLECKLASPLASDGTPRSTDARSVAMAGVAPPLVTTIHDKYASRHAVIEPLIHDTFGAIYKPSVKRLYQAGSAMQGRDRPGGDPCNPTLPLGFLAGYPLSHRVFLNTSSYTAFSNPTLTVTHKRRRTPRRSSYDYNHCR